jgi:DHA1 family inner membrane transport protein
LMHTPWVGAVIVLIALALTRFSGRLDKRSEELYGKLDIDVYPRS